MILGKGRCLNNDEIAKFLKFAKISSQQGFKSEAERKFVEDKYICKLGTAIPNGLNKDLESYAREMYDLHQDL